ncbi:MAG: HDIG domain-containing protein [Clostridiales bacterium]|jgi:putative nucleotidyltransferase with HDIG domain|nr:HDIG domain-containing protein [Clostridiales bacterium]MDR2749451.1 HDIG domain-containing protein [Clostridiales bacterium]
MKPSREEAFTLLKKYNESPALIKHALAVEGVMRRFARESGEDVEKWGTIGLLHDIDYERHPDEHCKKAAEILAAEGVDEEYIHGVCSHGYGICSDVEPTHRMEKVLYAIDELTGLVNAAAIMRPSKSVMDLEYKSLMKKYKSPNFAAGVDRRVIERGAQWLGVDLKFLVDETILGMREVADSIGLGAPA